MVGETLAGRYRIERLLGQGGMGSVFEATHTGTGRRVAVKVITAREIPKGDQRVARFEREARAAGALVTDHIAGILDAGEDPATGAPYMVMEYLEGEDLQHLLKKTGPLRPDVALRIAAQACLGLQKAHEAGVIHRDIKPANLFLARREEGAVLVKLLDFGIAKIQYDDAVDPQTALTNTGNVLGSPHYLSPEQARASKDVDPRTDVWSLGVTLYRALTGRTPHEKLDSFINLMMAICLQPAPPVQSFAPWVPPEVAEVVHRALEIDRDARFPSAAAMLDAIRPLCPDGWALQQAMLVPLDERERAPAPVGKRVPSLTPPTPTSASAAATAPSGSAWGSTPPPAPAETPAEPAPPRPRSRLGLTLAAVGVAGAALAAVVLSNRASPSAHPAAPASPAETAVVSSSPPSTPPAATSNAAADAARRVKLVVEPGDAQVEIDGAPVTPSGGVVDVQGPLGSAHRVRVWKGKSEVVGDVAITESGALPPKMEIAVAPGAPDARAPATSPESPRHASAPAPPPARAAAAAPPAPAAPPPASKVRTTFE